MFVRAEIRSQEYGNLGFFVYIATARPVRTWQLLYIFSVGDDGTQLSSAAGCVGIDHQIFQLLGYFRLLDFQNPIDRPFQFFLTESGDDKHLLNGFSMTCQQLKSTPNRDGNPEFQLRRMSSNPSDYTRCNRLNSQVTSQAF
jgi:hypothetical protein